MKIAIVGCGFIGQKRAKTLAGCQLVACVDHIYEKAEALAKQYVDCEALVDWRDIIQRKDIEAGQNAGCKTIWLNKNYQVREPTHPDFITTSFTQATECIKINNLYMSDYK